MSNPSKYSPTYLGVQFQRLASYRQQLIYAMRSAPAGNYLVVGKGDGFTIKVLRDLGRTVTVLDIDKGVQPDVVGSVDAIPLADGSFDVCVCCQVLEHLPYERFRYCLGELRRVSRQVLVLSLPDLRRYCGLSAKLGRFHLDLQCSIPRIFPSTIPVSRHAAHGHYWELGYRGYGLRRIRRDIKGAGWSVEQTRRVHELPWHTFFLLRKDRPILQRYFNATSPNRC